MDWSSFASAPSVREANTLIFEQCIIEKLPNIELEKISVDEIPEDFVQFKVFTSEKQEHVATTEVKFGEALFKECIEHILKQDPAVMFSLNFVY